MQAPEVLGGRYELRGVLGRGGMAEVRDAWDLRLDRPVAVKLLYPSVSTQPDTRRRFATEARAAAVVNHPHVVAVHDSGVHQGRHYIVLERLPGQSVADALARGGPMPAGHVRAIMRDVLSALGAAHARGVLHRDIKPANILFTRLGGVKIADFGVAKSADTPQTLTNRVFGTMAYLPADRIAGRPAMPADDLYALGVVAYEALTGRRAYPQESLTTLADAIAAGAVTPLSVLRPDVDPALALTVERAMSRDPRWRFASAEQMRACLDPPAATPQRTGVALAGAAVLTLLVLAALLVVL
ncbi:serine/threonine protein kinase [Mycolicibacterium chubuense]|nr:serine/threonine-protein kinase [Mycolicibacterium chubuense]ORA52992.1 serine/threonine protein kinase [Mycolicibacterium chubuense]